MAAAPQLEQIPEYNNDEADEIRLDHGGCSDGRFVDGIRRRRTRS
jgi:hypothetical protein